MRLLWLLEVQSKAFKISANKINNLPSVRGHALLKDIFAEKTKAYNREDAAKPSYNPTYHLSK